MSADEAARLQAAQAAGERYHARLAAELAATGRPRDLAFAATLLQIAGEAPTEPPVPGDDAPSQRAPRDPRIAQWRQLASARAGGDVLANALLLQGDDAAGADIHRQAIERWRRLEPDNFAPELLGNAPADAWLPRAGRYRRFDWHYYELLRWMQAALAAHPPVAEERAMQDGDALPADQVAALAALGIQMAVAMPNLTSLLAACKAAELDSAPGRRGDCRQVGQVMADDSDTRLGTAIGIALLRRTSVTQAERDDALARQRRNDWQMWQWGRLAGTGRPPPPGSSPGCCSTRPCAASRMRQRACSPKRACRPTLPPAGARPGRTTTPAAERRGSAERRSRPRGARCTLANPFVEPEEA